MTVQTNTNVASFNGNGVTQIFPIAFKFNNDTDLVVLLVDDDTGVSLPLTLNSDYTVSGEGDEEGGLINVVVAPAVGQRLKVSRIVDILQLRDLRNQGKFFAEVHEDALDQLTMIAQQHESGIQSALRVAESDPEPARIPSVAQRAGKILSFDINGNPQVVAPVTDSSQELRLQLANGTAFLVDGEVVGGLTRTIADIAALRTTSGRFDRDSASVVSYYGGWAGTARGAVGGGLFDWDATSTAADDGGMVIAVEGIATGRWRRRLDGSTVHIEEFGAVNDTDAIPQLRAARDFLTTIGGGVIRASGRYLVDSGNLEIDSDNILIDGYGPGKTIFERTSVQTGFAFWWARNTETNGGGLKNCELIGTTTNLSGNGGVAFGYDSGQTFNKANGWLLMNVVARRWSQYGVGINSGDGWLARDVRVLEHGVTSGNMASCIAFYVYPKSASANGKLHNIHAEISAASEAVSNGAAMKLQTHSNLQAEMLYAKGGAEQCVSIDSISGMVRNLTARANGSKPGVAVLNYNPAHSFTGKFVLDGVDCNDPLFSVSLLIAAAAAGETTPRLKGVTIKNVRCALVRVNARSAWQDCTFENFYCTAAFRLDHVTAGVEPPELPITGNKYSNIYAQSIEIRGDSSEILDCASTGNQFILVGSNNTADNIRSIKSAGNGIAVEGSNNTVTNLLSRSAVGRKLWIKSGDANIFQGVAIGGVAILNSGTNTNTTNVVQL